jgi:predicted O-methyltransferase YrrM
MTGTAAQQFVTRDTVLALLREMKSDPIYPEIKRLKELSMLHEEVLYLMRRFVELSIGRVVEIGTYIGGGTVVLGRAAQIYDKPSILSVEPGGKHDHDYIPSNDIWRDLESNLRTHNVTDYVRLHRGFSNTPSVVQAIREAAGALGIGLLIIDADGHVERDISLYADLLLPNCIIMLDDYVTTLAAEKRTTVERWVHSATETGAVNSVGVYGWGTWIGTWNALPS